MKGPLALGEANLRATASPYRATKPPFEKPLVITVGHS